MRERSLQAHELLDFIEMYRAFLDTYRAFIKVNYYFHYLTLIKKIRA